MEKVLTVVVPSYNVEKYIRQTLESLNHKAILEAIEVLVVDDGSQMILQKSEKSMKNNIPRLTGLFQKATEDMDQR